VLVLWLRCSGLMSQAQEAVHAQGLGATPHSLDHFHLLLFPRSFSMPMPQLTYPI